MTDPTRIDVVTNRQVRKYSRRENVARVAWGFVVPFFALSPRPFWFWRRWLLRCFGAKIGNNSNIYPSVQVTMPWNITIGNDVGIGIGVKLYALGLINIADRATISQGAHLCAGTHDWRKPGRPLLKLPITIGPDAWIAADAFIGPGVEIGARSIVGARAVVVKSVPEGQIVAGNPATVIRRVELDD